MARDEKQTYNRIERGIFNKPRFRSLSDNAKLLMLYLINCPHGNMTGMYVLGVGYAVEDLGWSREKYTKYLTELIDSKHILYDPENRIILDLNQITKFPPENPNQVTGAIIKLEELPNTPLFQEFKRLCEGLEAHYHKPLHEWLGKRLLEPLGKQEEEEEEEEEEESTEPEVFNLPSVEEINHEAYPKVRKDIFKVCENLKDIFPEAFKFAGQQLKKKMNPRAVLHTLTKCYMKKTFDKGAWAYCVAIIKVENGNFNERDHKKNS